jgi:CRISPR-associated protein Cmr3
VVLESDEVDERRPRARRLRPASLSGAGVTSDLAGEVEQWFIPPEDAESVEPVGGLWDRDLMADYLADDLPDPIELYEDSWERLSPLLPERRVGLAREGRTAKDGFLYSTTHLRSRESRGTSWGFLAAVADSPATSGVAPAGPVPLGGRMRLADVAEVDGVDWPAAPEEFPGGRVLVYVATPALWPAGWRPPLPADASLVAACTSGPRPVPIASTRQARHAGTGLLETVVLRWAVEPGSVYLLRFPDVGRAGQWAADVHGRSLGPALDRAGGSATAGQGTVGTDRTSTAGFGVVLCGRWTEGP